VALEWVYGGEAPRTVPPPDIPPAPKRAAGANSDYSIYPNWGKTSEETRTLFHELEELAKAIGSVRTDVFKSEISLKCTAAPGDKPPVVAYVHLRVRGGIRVHIHGKHLSAFPLEEGFTRPYHRKYREIIIEDQEHVRKAEPLLRAAYDDLKAATNR
jgi:hypothetical protein